MSEIPTNDPRFVFLATWAARWGAGLTLEGECGFGRECVGILVGNGYLDYAHLWEEFPDAQMWTPPDAYHKHDCMAVLGRGETALQQLYDWAKWLDDNGWTVEIAARRPADDIDLLMHGISIARLMPPAHAAA